MASKKINKKITNSKKVKDNSANVKIKVTTNKKHNEKNVDTQIKLNPKFDIKNLTMIILAILIISIFVVFVFLNFNVIISFFKKILSILNSIIIGFVLAYLTTPLYNFVLEKIKNQKYNKIIASFVCVLFLILLVFGLFALLIPQLISSISLLTNDIYYHGFNDSEVLLNRITNNAFFQRIPFLNEIKDKLSGILQPSVLFDQLNKYAEALEIKNIGNLAKDAMKPLIPILNFMIGIVVMVYALNMKDSVVLQFKKFFYALLKKEVTEKIFEECEYAHKVFTGFLFGKIVDSLIIGIICYIVCAILKMPYSILVSVIVGVTNIIPFFGPFIGAVPCFIFIVIENPSKGFIFLLFIFILQQFDGNILGPYILGDIIGIKSFYILFSILLFGGLFGFIGMIIGVPLWAVISKIFWEIIDSKLIKKQLPTNELEYKNNI